MERISTYCALCISRCGCVATVDDGKLVKVERDVDHPTGGAICIKAKTAPEFVHHPRRLRSPMVRTNPKGSADPGFRSTSWGEALELASTKLRAIAVYGSRRPSWSYNNAIDAAIIDRTSGSNMMRSYMCQVALATG
ncbi:MAG: hypothetical protein ACTSWI_01995 [Alphaproteobacteria bacterium]